MVDLMLSALDSGDHLRIARQFKRLTDLSHHLLEKTKCFDLGSRNDGRAWLRVAENHRGLAFLRVV
jgi:hypothetical protein